MTHTTKPRRGRGEGSIYRRADGRWVGQVDAGYDPVTGRRRYRRVVRRTRTDALRGLKELVRDADDGVTVNRTMTVSRYLNWWLDEVTASRVSDATVTEYRKRIRRLEPLIGRVKLHKLTTGHVQQAANQLAARYPRSAVIRGTLTTLRSALRWAVQAGELPRNVGEGVQAGQTASRPDETLTADEARAVVAAAAGTDMHALVYMALYYGLRIGELLDLRWQDVDLDAGTLTVARAKTRAGERDLPLTDEAVEVLRAHRARQKVVPLNGRLFPDPAGGRRWPGRVREAWQELLAGVGVAHVCRNCDHPEDCSPSIRRFHASRHTAGTLLLEEGVALEVVSAILGHSSIKITAEVYARVRADLKRRGLNQRTTSA